MQQNIVSKPMIRALKDLETFSPERIQLLSPAKKKELEEIIKIKLLREKEYQKEFNKRYAYERAKSTLYLVDYSFGFISKLQGYIYQLFLIYGKEQFKDDFVSNELKKLNDEFVDAILTVGIGSFNDALQAYKSKIQSLQDRGDYSIMNLRLDKENTFKLIKGEYKGEVIKQKTFNQDTFNNLMISNLIYEDTDNQEFHGFLLYNTTDKTSDFYLSSHITLTDIQLVGFYRKILLLTYGIKNCRFHVFENEGEFEHFKRIVTSYVKDSIRKIREIVDESLRVWFLNSVHDSNVKDYSLNIFKDTKIFKAETQYGKGNEGYKTIFNISPSDMGVISNNISSLFKIPIQGKITESSFTLGRIKYRIEIVSTTTFQISIRRLVGSDKLYTLEEIQRNGLETTGLLWKDSNKKDSYGNQIQLAYPLGNRDYDKEDAIEMELKRGNIWKEGMKIPGMYPMESYIDNPEEIERMMKELQKKSGVTVVSAPTGMGKTSFLKTFLQNLYRWRLKTAGINMKIIFMECPQEESILNFYPIEYDEENVKETERFIKATKRLNPQFSMFGESRDVFIWEKVLSLSGTAATATTSHESNLKEFLLNYIGNASEFKAVDLQTAMSKLNVAIFLYQFGKIDFYQNREQFAKEGYPLVKNGVIKFVPKSTTRGYLNTAFLGTGTKGIITQERIDKMLEYTEEKKTAFHSLIHPIDWDKSFQNEDESTNEENYQIFTEKYEKVGFLYERMFSQDMKKFIEMFIDRDKGILLNSDRERLQANAGTAYQVIGWKNTLLYKKFKTWLQGGFNKENGNIINLIINDVVNLEAKDKIDFFNALEKEFTPPVIQSKPQSK